MTPGYQPSRIKTSFKEVILLFSCIASWRMEEEAVLKVRLWSSHRVPSVHCLIRGHWRRKWSQQGQSQCRSIFRGKARAISAHRMAPFGVKMLFFSWDEHTWSQRFSPSSFTIWKLILGEECHKRRLSIFVFIFFIAGFEVEETTVGEILIERSAVPQTCFIWNLFLKIIHIERSIGRAFRPTPSNTITPLALIFPIAF